MSEVELQQQLDNANQMVKIGNAKLAAANQTLGSVLGQSNDVQAANILYQERERELMSKCSELQFKIDALEKEIVALKDEISKLKPPVQDDVIPATCEQGSEACQEESKE